MTGCSSETGLSGMLESTDYDSLDQISPFLGVITDVICRNETESVIKKLFTENVEFIQCLQIEK